MLGIILVKLTLGTSLELLARRTVLGPPFLHVFRISLHLSWSLISSGIVAITTHQLRVPSSVLASILLTLKARSITIVSARRTVIELTPAVGALATLLRLHGSYLLRLD